MTTLTLLDCAGAEAVALESSPCAKVSAVVRERCKANKLNFILADRAVQHALAHFGQHGSLPRAIDFGQRKADALAGKRRELHAWRREPDDAA